MTTVQSVANAPLFYADDLTRGGVACRISVNMPPALKTDLKEVFHALARVHA